MLPFQQVAEILTQVVYQATGKTILTPQNTGEFVNVATTLLTYGVDPVIKALSTVMGRTIFSIRPYDRKFRMMEASADRWGFHTRTITFTESNIEDNDTYKYPALWDDTKDPASGDGESVDQWVIKKERAVQTNFYGGNVFGDHISIFTEPFEIVFRNPAEFSQFLGTMMLNWKNKREQYLENIARALLINGVAAIIDENDPDRVVHLLTEYNTFTGQSLTPQTVYQADNFKSFVAWAYSKIDQIAGLMSERSELYQTKLDNNYIVRHTPSREQVFYRYVQSSTMIDTMILPGTFNPQYLRTIPSERVNFWQSIRTPSAINTTPKYMDTDGSIKTGNPVLSENVFGILCDREFMGYSIIKNKLKTTTENARAEYYNIYWHTLVKAWLDNTEKAVVFCLD